MAAAAAAGALLLSGCGTTGTAAIVDGSVITEQSVQVATQQINDQIAAINKKNPSQASQPLTTSSVLNWLIWAPSLLAESEAVGQAQSDASAKALLTAVPDPDPATILLVRAQGALNAVQNDTNASHAVLVRIQHLKVTVNPRFGSFEPTGGLLNPASPNWLPAQPKA